MKDTFEIKGLCENCGFTHEGTLVGKDGHFPNIKCPKCGKETLNFDERDAVDALNKDEGIELTYTKVEKYEVIAD